MWGTCVGAEEALALRNIVTGVAGWNDTILLLPPVDVTRQASELRGLLQFSIAVLGEKHTNWSEKPGRRASRPYPINVVE